MSFSADDYRNRIGRASFLGVGGGAERLFIYATFAGNPTGNLTPDHVGQECFDTTNQRFYKAVGMNAADWRAMTA